MGTNGKLKENSGKSQLTLLFLTSHAWQSLVESTNLNFLFAFMKLSASGS
jgi:hypothetical protein